ncbi:MAG: cell division protein FtsW [Firmicutes bacterium]|nr:cell division protein FtsW [Bacillota bacterium]
MARETQTVTGRTVRTRADYERKYDGILKRKPGTVDHLMVILVAVLTVFGVVMVFSASYYDSISDTGSPYTFFINQAISAATGIIMMLILSRINYHMFSKLAIPITILGFILLCLIFTPLGRSEGGATRAVYMGFMIMPGEIAKVVLIIFGAWYFSKDRTRAKKFMGLLPFGVYTLAVVFLIYKQPNLSTAITVMIIGLGIAFFAGMQKRYLLIVLLVIAAGLAYLIFIDKSYQHDRIMCWFDPFKYELGIGFQVVQSLYAIATGGLFGKGLGMSVQKNLYLPEPQNDFIIAIIGEELGFLGIALMLAVFMLLLWRIFRVAIEAEDDFGALLAGGAGVMIGAQVVLNIAVVTSSAPPTGIALPFISYGRNALWICTALMGIVLNVSRHTRPEPEEDVEENEE